MALVVVRISGPAKHAGVKVLQGKDVDQIYPNLVSSADLVVIQRDFPRFWNEYKQIVIQARTEGKPVVYEIDDLLFKMPLDHSHRREYVDVLVPMLSAVLNADMVTVSTTELLDFMSQLNTNTRMIHNYLDDRVWEIKQKAKDSTENKSVVIGYMGGETHQLDIRAITPTLLKILQAYSEKIILRFWGGKPPAELLDSPNVEWIPINQFDYAEFARFFVHQECDLFIAPLRDNPFNRAKSGLKFFEYSALGSPGVYSRLSAYEGVIDHGVNGFLAREPEEWEKCLVELIENPQTRVRMGHQARELVKDRWLLSQNYSEWYEIYLHAWDNYGEIKNLSPNLDIISAILDQAYEYQQETEQYYKELSDQNYEILESRSWKALQFVQGLRLKLLPKGGGGDKMLNRLLGNDSINKN
jgi:glycosyltransferase involved in cell wall biosynthesis